MQMFGFFVAALFLGELGEGVALRGAAPLCPQLKLKYGKVRYRQKGKLARFLCNTGYTLAGDRYSACVHGQWENSTPKCVRATCAKAKPPLNGLIYPSHGGAVLNFFCKGNFELKGANITYCDGLNWDNPLPTCLATNTTPPLGCDFEAEDICGWNHDLNHDFDWKRLNFATPSGAIGTGPSYDHTKGPGKDGYYMYIESSARNPNDTARLISPVFDRTTTNTCLEFYYHMYGLTTGDLRVFLKKTSETWDLDPKKALFDKRGNQGNKWFRAVLEMGAVDDDFQIVIEGVRGSSYVSDIAIDDVRIILNCSQVDVHPLIESTTETSEMSSGPPMSVESCQNRCNTSDTQTVKSVITCDCDDRCVDLNRCCPDYFDYCAFGTTLDDVTGETLTTSPTAMRTRPTRMKTRPTAMKTTRTPTARKPTVAVTTTWNITTTRKPTTVSTTKPSTKQSKIIYVKPDDVVTPSPREELTTEYFVTDQSLHQKIVIPPKTVENNTRTVVFAVGVVFGVLFGVVGMAFVARRYRVFRCGNLRGIKQSSNGDSQSDVRFLTGDEILDFNLPQGYDTM